MIHIFLSPKEVNKKGEIKIELVDIDMILSSKEKSKKIEFLSWLWEYIESYSIIRNIESLVNSLINYAIEEKDLEVKEKILDTIQIALTYRDTRTCKFYLLENHINIFSDDMILIIIGIFELTYDARYTTILQKLSNHINKDISREAKEALTEIKYN